MGKKKAPSKGHKKTRKTGQEKARIKRDSRAMTKRKTPKRVHVDYIGKQETIPMPNEPETATMLDIGTEKRLSTKAIVGKLIGKKITERMPLFRVYGIMTGLKSGQSNFGEWIGLKGKFYIVRKKGRNLDSEAPLYAPLWIPPPTVLDLIRGHLRGANPDDLTVEFCMDISAIPSTNEQGWEYAFETIIEPQGVDLMTRLIQRVQEVEKKLEVHNGEG